MPKDVLLVGWDDVGIGEATSEVCPQLATLRSQAYEVGLAFSHPVCSQSRAGILFGSYGKKIGTIRELGGMFPGPSTPSASLVTLPQVLRDAGYQTCLVGKWHCGPAPSGSHWALGPLERGYQSWRAGTRVNLNTISGQDYRDWERVEAEDGTYTVVAHEHGYATELQLDAAVAWWMSRGGLGPRFMHVALNAPHGPLHHQIPSGLLAGWPAPTATSTKREKYRAMLRSADTVLGTLLDMVGPQTRVFLYSDNGSDPDTLDASSPWLPDRAKGTVYDGGVRVLMVGRWPGCPVGLDPDRMNSLVDLPAGILASVGLQVPASWDGVGTNRLEILSEARAIDSIERLARTRSHALRQATPIPAGSGPMVEELFALGVDPEERSPLDLEGVVGVDAEALAYLRQLLEDAAIS